ncbi:hypothetical protein P2318_07805 [Myxococcaceae bacterium GXIMD 01537]
MSSHRRHLPWSVALLLSIAAVVSAEPAASVEPGADEASYSSNELVSTEPGEEGMTQTLLCPAVRCSSVEDCRSACPNGVVLSCTLNACRYQSSGGGGGGGGGPTCPSTRCLDDEDCVCSGRQGSCVERACTY